MPGKKPFDPFDESTYPEPEDDIAPIWPDVLEQLLLTYRPADAQSETDTLTTAEIQTSLYSFCGQCPLKTELFNTLIEKGYRYRVANGNELHWMVKKN